ncbi:hypothetical protein LWI29_017814 [Acer saccharum]|uniref:Uncharacterized protein n=1 Tax=Acer saccharum TaxID=4024 RepID=A0AA39VNI0_ACESA|nr:hypothetical protein LWI29_017814 [Acer saccharum]
MLPCPASGSIQVLGSLRVLPSLLLSYPVLNSLPFVILTTAGLAFRKPIAIRGRLEEVKRELEEAGRVGKEDGGAS